MKPTMQFEGLEIRNVATLTRCSLDNEEGVRVSLFAGSTESAPSTLKWPFASFLQIAFVQEGGVAVTLPDAGRQTIPANHWFVLSPIGWQATCEFQSSTRMVIVECGQAVWENLVEETDKFSHNRKACFTCNQRKEALFLKGSLQPYVRQILDRIPSIAGNRPSNRLRMQALGLELLAAIVESAILSTTPKPEPCFRKEEESALNAAAEYLEKNLAESLSLAEISQHVHLNEFKLKKGFREYYRTTVFGYLRQKRMERASRILAIRQCSVIEAAQEVGYSNPSHFSRAFRKTFGMNPREYLLKNRNAS